MDKAGIMRIGAMLAVLAVLGGAFATLPYWTARAETTPPIWGLVRGTPCGGNNFLSGVRVTLVDAHSGATFPEFTDTDGVYNFTGKPTGSYFLKFNATGYYLDETSPFRYDGSIPVSNKTVCLQKMPDATTTQTTLVLNQVTSAHTQETIQPTYTYVALEDMVSTFKVVAGLGYATTSHSPVVFPSGTNGPPVYYFNAGGRHDLVYQFDYTWYNLFNGTLQILNPTILAELGVSTIGRHLNISYSWSATTDRLAHYPVVPGSYTVFKGGAQWNPGPSTWSLNVNTGIFQFLGDFIFGTNSATITYNSTGVVPHALVSLFNRSADQVVASGYTNDSGYVTLSIWPATLELQATKDQYQPYSAFVDTSLTTNWTNPYVVIMPNGTQVFGHVFRAGGGPPITAGVVGYLYNKNPLATPFAKVVSAKVQGSLYTFYAEAGQSYRMIIDANGYQAAYRDISTASGRAQEINVTLSPSQQEVYRTNVTYDNANWSKVTVQRQIVLRNDSAVPGLDLPNIRSVALQIEDTAGMGTPDGTLTPAEANNFRAWYLARLQDPITTDSFLTTNGLAYNSTGTWSASVDFAPTVSAFKAVYINTTATYIARGTPAITNGQDKYFVNVTVPNDQNATVYQNQSAVVNLPHGYEMVAKRVTGTITTTNYTSVIVDPHIGTGTSEIDMTVRLSLNGTARGAVTGPSGRFHVYNDTDDNYTVIVAADRNMTFSASGSTDPIGDINNANFTWRFKNNTDPNIRGWGMTATYNYTGAGPFVVNLTVRQAGGNKTYRDMKVYVDDTAPTAVIKDNHTIPQYGSNVNNTDLHINETEPIRFDGTGSFDIIYPGAPLNNYDKIPDVEGNRGYNWDFNGDLINESNSQKPTYIWPKPGRYNMTLTIVDWVGHRSVPARLTVIVNDTKAPVPNFVILDPNASWAEVTAPTTMIEGKSYVFNASSTKDDYDSIENLTYHWGFPGPASGTPSLNSTGNYSNVGKLGYNITVTWSVFNLSYNVTLKVTDKGFGSGKVNSANISVSKEVGVDTTKHPDLKYVTGTFQVQPGQPSEGQSINVSFEVENIKNRLDATNVKVRLYTRDANGNLVLVSDNPEWRNGDWSTGAPASNHAIPTDKKVRFIFTTTFPNQGNHSLEVRFNDTNEPYTWVGDDNKYVGSVFVSLAGWVLPAAFAGIVVLIILVAVGLRAYSRYKAGEPIFRRREKKEKKKLGKEEEEEEPEAEAEDRKGKKRF